MSTTIVPDYDAETIARFEHVRADSLRFGDLLAYFGAHVRSTHQDNMVRVQLIRNLGQQRTNLAFYPDDVVTVLRAGAGR